MAYMKDSTGKRLDSFEVAPLTELGREQIAGKKNWALIPARAALASGTANIVWVGDSETEGLKASVVTKRWLTGHAIDLAAKHNPAGINRGYGYVPAYYASTYTTAPTVAWAYTGTTAQSQDTGLGRRCVSLQSASGNGSGTMTFTGTSIKLFFSRKFTSGDSVTVTIDGGAPTTVSIPSSNVSGLVIGGHAWQSPTMSSGSHTVVVTRATGSPIFEGGYVYDGDENSGIKVWDAGHSGYLAQSYVDSQTAAPQWAGAITTIAPELIGIALGTNDYGTGLVTPTEFEVDLQNLIALCRSKNTKQCSFVLLMQHERTPAGTTSVAPYAQYVDAAFRVAAADTGGVNGQSGVAVLDISRRMPAGSGGGTDALGLYADGVHYTDLGNEVVRQHLTGFIASN